MKNLKRRIEKIEKEANASENPIHIIIPNEGETKEQAKQRYLAEHPDVELDVHSHVLQVNFIEKADLACL